MPLHLNHFRSAVTEKGPFRVLDRRDDGGRAEALPGQEKMNSLFMTWDRSRSPFSGQGGRTTAFGAATYSAPVSAHHAARCASCCAPPLAVCSISAQRVFATSPWKVSMKVRRMILAPSAQSPG